LSGKALAAVNSFRIQQVRRRSGFRIRGSGFFGFRHSRPRLREGRLCAGLTNNLSECHSAEFRILNPASFDPLREVIEKFDQGHEQSDHDEADDESEDHDHDWFQ
jgi:hypothetical protein